MEMTHKITLPINKTKDMILEIIKIGGMGQSIYLEGPSGIGKSEMIAELAKILGADFFDIRLGVLDVLDLNGIGIPLIKERKAIWTRPEILPDEYTTKPTIIFLDEFNHANETVLGSAYQFVLERKVNTHQLPKNCLIIGAGNSVDDKGIAFNIPSPLQNRFIKINVISEIEDWLGYAKKKDVDWRTRAFLKTHSELLHNFNANPNEDNFTTPRSWIKVSTFLDSDKELFKVVSNGILGFSASLEFIQFLELIKKIPDLELLMDGKDVVELNSELSSSYAFLMLIDSFLKNNIQKISPTQIINLINYCNKQEHQEVMQLIIFDLLDKINSNWDNDKQNEIHLFFYKNKTIFDDNRIFQEKMKSFANSLK
jgi:hypothetical protein